LKSARATLARPLAAGFVLAAGLALAAAPASHPAPEFRQAAGGVYGRLQMLRQLEKEMVAQAANPDRRAQYRAMRDAARQRIDEQLALAGAAAASDADRSRLAQLATLTAMADLRYENLRTALETGRELPPLAGLGD
jgi:hypothetical protein